MPRSAINVLRSAVCPMAARFVVVSCLPCITLLCLLGGCTAAGKQTPYPTILEDFNIPYENEITVERSRDVTQFNCKWQWGNPPKSVLLLNPLNRTLETVSFVKNTRSEIRHNEDLNCNSSGQYRCVVEGTGQFKALTVLVRCPFVFKDREAVRRVQTDQSAKVSFQATSYTTDLSFCELRKPNKKKLDCNSGKSEVIVTGSPPDVVISVTVKRVTKTDEGKWTLIVSNRETSNGNKRPTANFSLEIREPVTTTSAGAEGASPDITTGGQPSLATSAHTEVSDPPQKMRLVWIIGIIVGIIIVIVVIVVLVVCITRRRKKVPVRASASPRAAQGANQDCEMIVNDFYATSENPQMITNDFYEGSDDIRRVQPPAAANAVYEPVSQEGAMYVGQDEIQRNKARNKAKAQKTVPQQEEGAMYVGQDEIQRNKARNKAKAQKTVPQRDPGPQEGLYSNP